MSLEGFLQKWDARYQLRAAAIPMFDPARPLSWSPEQKKFFARAFLHARGHFSTFLWHLGGIAPSKEHKNIVLANIRDEFGIGADDVSRLSHDQIYWRFAEAVGLDMNEIREEIIDETTNLPFIRKFNKGHLRYILTRPWDEAWSAFLAYERLDKGDYGKNLYPLAVRMGVSGKGLVFYEVHREVTHYEVAAPLLAETWERNPNAVRAGFQFIFDHQIKMWQELNSAVEAYGK